MATASRKPRSTRPVAAVSDKPDAVVLNLDTLELERTEKPFVVRLGGRNLTFKDPKEIYWQDLADLDDPTSFAEAALEEEDQEHFLEYRLETGRMMELMRRYRRHFGMDVDPGNPAA
jgi:hypothetical protein